MDPSNTGVLARALDGIKQWPIWLFVAIALSLTVFVVVPDFLNLAPPTLRAALVFSTIVAWIFSCARAAKPLTEVVLAYLHHRDKVHIFSSPQWTTSVFGTSQSNPMARL